MIDDWKLDSKLRKQCNFDYDANCITLLRIIQLIMRRYLNIQTNGGIIASRHQCETVR